MRIVSSNQTNLKKDIPKSDDTVKLPGKGNSIKAQVIEVEGKKVVIEYKGARYEGELDQGSARSNLKGSLVDFLILENSPSLKLTVESEGQVRNTDGSINKLSSSQVESILDSLGLAKNETNIKLVSALKSFQIPLTKENIQELKEFITSKNMLGDKLDKMTTSMDEKSGTVVIDKERPVKEVLIDLIKQESLGKISDIQAPKINMEENLSKTMSQALTKNTEETAIITNLNVDKETTKLLNNFKNVNIDSNHLDKETLNTIRESINLVSAQKDSETQIVSKSEIAVISDEDNQGQNALKEIANLLKSIDENSFLFNKELQLPNNIKNLYGYDKMINMKDSLTSQLGRLISEVNGTKDIEVLSRLVNELDNIKADDLESLKNQIEKIEKELSDKGNLSDSLKNSIDSLKESVDYLKEINNQIFYMQVPLKMNDQIVDMELGFRHKSKTKDGSFKIFISLETHNLGLVQSLIKIKDNTVELSLKVDEDQAQYFEDNLYLLEESLKDNDYKVATINLLERESKLDLSDLLKENNVEEASFNALI